MANILTTAEAAAVLRCLTTDPDMLALLPLVDSYIKNATGHDWTADSPIEPTAKNYARLLLTRWHESPAMLGQGITAIEAGLRDVSIQLDVLAMRYKTFEGLSGTGYIQIDGVSAGDTVSSVTGVQGVSGDQAASFETVISEDSYILQVATSDLSSKWFKALITPLEAL